LRRFIVAALVVAAACPAVAGPKKDRVVYEPYKRDPVLKRIIEQADSVAAIADSVTAEIKARNKAEQKARREERKVIRFDVSGIKRPGSPEEFDAPFHFPPVAQHLSGMCWCFSTTSFIESEVKRLHGREVKLSELHTVYWEYVEKARGYVARRGDQPFAEGGEADGALIVMEKYGAVPAERYTGLKGRTTHNHAALIDELKTFLEMCRDHGYWDEESVVEHVRVILDRHIGRPPERFEYEGRMMTPKEFYDEVLLIDRSDYVQLMSTLSVPFHTMDRYDVPDNWRPTYTWYNVPLEDFMRYLREGAKRGYTACIGGDVSEPGYYGEEDIAVVPTFDIPGDYIDQDSRELRFYNRTTQDDHALHLLATRRVGGRDWFLIKDSSRASRRGKYDGYLFFRDDYVRLKMLFCVVHRDVVADIMPRIEEARMELGRREPF
jgi:bleomycin hydrolase